MKIKDKLFAIQQTNKSRLCVGLDTELSKLPIDYDRSPESLCVFNKSIIEATKDLVCAYKINFAFYEQYGADGMLALRETLTSIPNNIITIADAKRGDIGNTSRAYATSIFDEMKFDSITVSPYMGKDSVEPFLQYNDKIIFVLALTSNVGSSDFQRLDCNGKPLYQHIIETSQTWNTNSELGYVVGATHPNELKEIRTYTPNNILLIPGIGTQGGDVTATMEANGNSPAIVNVSRGIIYASNGADYAEEARFQSEYYRKEIGM